MPKRIVTAATLPKIERELDRWQGKLTWPLFCAHVAKVLCVPSVSKHTMYLYPRIKDAFQRRQNELREAAVQTRRDPTVEFAIKRISDLEAEVTRLQHENTLLLDMFRRWQYNAYVRGVRMEQMAWDQGLPGVDRSGHARDADRRPAKRKTAGNSAKRRT